MRRSEIGIARVAVASAAKCRVPDDAASALELLAPQRLRKPFHPPPLTPSGNSFSTRTLAVICSFDSFPMSTQFPRSIGPADSGRKRSK